MNTKLETADLQWTTHPPVDGQVRRGQSVPWGTLPSVGDGGLVGGPSCPLLWVRLEGKRPIFPGSFKQGERNGNGTVLLQPPPRNLAIYGKKKMRNPERRVSLILQERQGKEDLPNPIFVKKIAVDNKIYNEDKSASGQAMRRVLSLHTVSISGHVFQGSA